MVQGVPDLLLFCLCNYVERAREDLSLKLSQFMPVPRKPGIQRNILRQTLERNGAHVLHSSSLNFEIPSLVHKPTVNLPMVHYLHFEVALLAYLTMAMFIQYINIYKTNVYEIDVYLLVFICIVLLRRLAWILLKQTLASEVVHTFSYWSKVCGKALVFFSLFLLTLCSLYNIVQTSAIEDVLFLCYPFGIYLWTFGCTLNPCTHPVLFKLGAHQSKYVLDLILYNASLFHQAVTLQIPVVQQNHTNTSRTKSKSLKDTSTDRGYGGGQHNGNGHIHPFLPTESSCVKQDHCPMSPDTVRYEAECLRTDFNLRMKQIVFNSVVSAYYVGFIPVQFNQNGSLFFDSAWSVQHIVFTLLTVFVLLMNFLIPHHYVDGLHKCATHLGGWTKYNGQRETPHVWSPLTIWPQAALVRHSKGLFRAMEKQNTAVPGDSHHTRFYVLFKSPIFILNILCTLQLGAVVYQLYAMMCSTAWYQCISVVPMCAFNHYLLFRLLRDRVAIQANLDEHLLCSTR